MGRERSFTDYMRMVGLDPVNKVSGLCRFHLLIILFIVL